MIGRRAAIAALCLVSTACQTLTDQPAHLVAGDRAAQQQLSQTLRGVLNTDTRLATNALVDSNLLIIQLAPRQTLQNRQALGRTMTPPIRFELVRHGRDCVLIDRRNNARHALPAVDCVEIDPTSP